jgi:hypothetical protein
MCAKGCICAVACPQRGSLTARGDVASHGPSPSNFHCKSRLVDCNVKLNHVHLASQTLCHSTQRTHSAQSTEDPPYQWLGQQHIVSLKRIGSVHAFDRQKAVIGAHVMQSHSIMSQNVGGKKQERLYCVVGKSAKVAHMARFYKKEQPESPCPSVTVKRETDPNAARNCNRTHQAFKDQRNESNWQLHDMKMLT